MAEIRFEPWGLVVKGEDGDSVLDVALENAIPLQHACGGDAVCSTCAIRVVRGDAWLSSQEDLEQETLDKLLPQRTLQTRLACQAQLTPSSESGKLTVVSMEEEKLPSP